MNKTSPSSSSYLDIILQSPRLIGEGKFCAVCRLVLQKMEDNHFLEGRQPKTIAFVIASNVLDFYYHSYLKPITKEHMIEVIDKKSITIYSNENSKKDYKKFQQKLIELLTKMKNAN